MEHGYGRQRGSGDERGRVYRDRDRERDRFQGGEGEREDWGRLSQDRWGRGPRNDNAGPRNHTTNGNHASGPYPLARRPSFEQDRYARRAPPLPAGPPGSGQSSQSHSQSSIAGPNGASHASSSYSRQSSPPYDARDTQRDYNRERFSSNSNGQRSERASSMNGSPPASDRTARRFNGPYANGRPRSLSPPLPPHNRLRFGEPAPYEDTTRRAPIPRQRDDRDYRGEFDDPPQNRMQRSREPSWSDNRKPYTNGHRPSLAEGSAPTVIWKRSRYDPEIFDRRPQDNGWAARAPRPNGVTNGWRPDKGKGPAYEDDDRSYAIRMAHNSDRARSPDRASSSTARSRGRRSPSPSATEHDQPYRSPASNAGSSQSTSRNSDRYAPEYDRHELPLSARIQREPMYSAPPTPSRTSLSSPRKEYPPVDSRIPSESPRSARAVSASQSPRFPSKPPWSGARRRASESPPPQHRHSQVSAEFTSPRSLADRIAPLSSSNQSQPRAQDNRRSLTPPPRNQSQAIVASLPPSSPPPLSTSTTASNTLSQPPASPKKLISVSEPTRLAPASASKATPAPFDASTLRAQSQNRKSPTPTPAQDEKIPKAAIVNIILDATTVNAPPSPQQENSRPLPGGLPANPFQQSQSSRPPSSSSDSKDTCAEPLRAPVPLRQTAESSSIASASSSSAVTAEPSAKPAGTPPTISMEIGDASQETVDMDLSMDMEEPRPSSPLSELPNSQAHIEEEEPESQEPAVPAGEEDDTEDDDFERTLLSVIEKEDSRDVEMEDLSEILEDNRFRTPVTLPFPVQPLQEGADPFAVDDIVTNNHDVLEQFLHRSMDDRDKRRGIKIVRLRQQYKEFDDEWQVHCHKLEKIRNRQKRRQQAAAPPLTPSIDSSGLPFIATPATPSILAPSGRTNRRATNTLGYGDAARSEAEFLEILARLEDADMADPNLRAMRTTATVPDMIIDPGERQDLPLTNFKDDNGLVLDPFEHYGINKHPDNWTEEEIAVFCRRYASYPKQFGKIAAALPDKTIPQCVLFYYRSKKKIDFRALVDKRSRDGKRRKGKKTGEAVEEAPGVKKGPSLLGNLKRSRVEEEYEEDEDEPQTPGSAIARESAVLSTAKALTRQLHGATSEDTAGLSYNSKPFDDPAQASSSLLPSRQPTNGKKAAHFLSPPPGPEVDGIAPPSDGALAAAEALGVLASAVAAAPSLSRGPGFRQKKRKSSISEAMDDTSFGDESTPKGTSSNKRARGPTSSYWSVADKNEFVRLLGVHGKAWPLIADGIESKTAVQCKNFFQNNTKKMGLMDIVAQAEEADPDSRMSGVIVEELEMPSIYSQEESLPVQPATGYFAPHRQSNGEAEEGLPSSGGGGMHLRNLLDDAPDAEGGANHALNMAEHSVSKREEEDSATEDEADPARYALEQQKQLQHRRISSNVQRFEPIKQALYRSSNGEYPHDTVEVDRRTPTYYDQPPYRDSRHSPGYNTRDLASPVYPSVLSVDRGFSHSLPPPNGRFPSFPPSRQWSPYESRTIYSQPTPSISASFRNDREYGRDERGTSEEQGRYSPPRSAYYRRLSLGEQEMAQKGLPQPVSAAAYSHSPYYDSPHYGPPSSSLRQSEDPDARPPYPPYSSSYHLARSR